MFLSKLSHVDRTLKAIAYLKKHGKWDRIDEVAIKSTIRYAMIKDRMKDIEKLKGSDS